MKKRTYPLGSIAIPMILIVVSVVLQSFAMLSLMSAKQDQTLSSRVYESSVAYYQAYGQLQQDYQQLIDGTVESVSSIESYVGKDDICWYFHRPISDQMDLVMVISMDDNTMVSCRVVNMDEWEVDDTLHIWNGE